MPDPPDKDAEFSEISSGLTYACGLGIGGAISCWGLGPAVDSPPPAGAFSSVSAGRRHACALDSDGEAVCWGDDKYGRATPPPNARFISVAAGTRRSCGVAEFGDIVCWGDEMPGSAAPPEGPFTALALGGDHACALRTGGETVCWGDDEFGQASPPPTAFSQIAAGAGRTCGIAREGGLECWGRVSVSDHSEKFASVSAGYDERVCALTAEGAAKCWLESPPAEDPLNGAWLESPVEMFPWPLGGLAVVDRRGYVEIHHPEGGEPTIALDLTDRTTCCSGERGMLSAALDPDFDRLPFIYIYWQTHNGDPDANRFEGRVSRFPVMDGGEIYENGELVILSVPQSWSAHFGGALRFGADGMLYLGLGDRGVEDPRLHYHYNENHPSRDLSILAGKIIRIDVRGATAGTPYRAPPDNPFLDAPGARREIWAYGLRNPWRMSFAPNGDLIVADVAEKGREEVSIAARGANLGWPYFQGSQCNADDRRLCDGAENYTFPIHEYSREDGACAIIGGVTAPDGKYIFGDHCSGRVWALERTAPDVWAATEIAETPGALLAFGTDAAGAVYALTRGRPPAKVSE